MAMVRKSNNNEKQSSKDDAPHYPPELTIPRRHQSQQQRRSSRRSSNRRLTQDSRVSALSAGDDEATSDQLGGSPYHASYNRRASTETIGTMSVATAGLRSSVMTVEMQALQTPPTDDIDIGNVDDNEITNAAAPVEGRVDRHVGIVAFSDDAVIPPFGDHDDNDSSTAQEQKVAETRRMKPQSHQPRQLIRQASRRRKRDRHDFRTSITTIGSHMSSDIKALSAPDRHNLISSTDEDPSFWGVSNRWFSDAGEFVGELTGMATRRIDDEAGLPRTDGVDIECAADYDDENDSDDGSDLGELSGSSLNDMTPFDEMSSLGDTPTGIFTNQTRKQFLRSAWFVTMAIMLLYIASQVIWHSSSSFRKWSDSRDHITISAGFGMRHSRRYGKMKKKLIDVFFGMMNIANYCCCGVGGYW